MQETRRDYKPPDNVLQFEPGAVAGTFVAIHRGRTYVATPDHVPGSALARKNGSPGWWRVNVDGVTLMGEDGTTAWGTKARAFDAANTFAINARTVTPTGGDHA